MPASHINSPGYRRAKQIGDAALKSTEGVTVHFTVAEYGSLEAAKYAAKRFQSTFCNMRLTARRKTQRALGRREWQRDADIPGPFDTLACNTQVNRDHTAWLVHIVREFQIDLGATVIDNATGEEIAVFNQVNLEADGLNVQCFDALQDGINANTKPNDPLSPEQRSFLLHIYPHAWLSFGELWGWERPDLATLVASLDPLSPERVALLEELERGPRLTPVSRSDPNYKGMTIDPDDAASFFGGGVDGEGDEGVGGM